MSRQGSLQVYKKLSAEVISSSGVFGEDRRVRSSPMSSDCVIDEWVEFFCVIVLAVSSDCGSVY